MRKKGEGRRKEEDEEDILILDFPRFTPGLE